MGDLGLVASRYQMNTDSLRKFNSALRYFRTTPMDEPTKSTAETGKLLSVLRPICEALDGKLSKSPSLDDNEIVDILNQKHSTDWQKYRNRIIEITNRLEGGRPKMNAEELNALEDVADAIDIECAFLFRRMSAGR